MIQNGDMDNSGGWFCTDLAVSHYNSNQIFSAFVENPYKVNYHVDAVSMSRDGGDSWVSIGEGLYANVLGFAISPHERVLYATTAGASLAKINLDFTPTSAKSHPPVIARRIHHTFSYPTTTKLYDLRGRLVKKIAVNDARRGLDGELRAGAGKMKATGIYLRIRTDENGVYDKGMRILAHELE